MPISSTTSSAKGFDPLAYRFYCFGAHYRSKLNFTWEGMEGAQNALRKLQAEARRLPSVKAATKGEWLEKFTKALSDDLNTSEGLAVVWEMLKSKADDKEKASNLLAMDEVLGLGLKDIIGKPVKAPANIVAIAEERQLARQSKDWSKSDELRDAIKAKGWIVEDGKDGGYDLQPLS
jgi:cysteinyl-tRNA synthetase